MAGGVEGGGHITGSLLSFPDPRSLLGTWGDTRDQEVR